MSQNPEIICADEPMSLIASSKLRWYKWIVLAILIIEIIIVLVIISPAEGFDVILIPAFLLGAGITIGITLIILLIIYLVLKASKKKKIIDDCNLNPNKYVLEAEARMESKQEAIKNYNRWQFFKRIF